jgi:hypothetical protein
MIMIDFPAAFYFCRDGEYVSKELLTDFRISARSCRQC